VVSQVVKVLVGRPRPDLIARCMPRLGATNSPVFGLVTSAICTQTNKFIMRDGFRSFPSAHSSRKSFFTVDSNFFGNVLKTIYSLLCRTRIPLILFGGKAPPFCTCFFLKLSSSRFIDDRMNVGTLEKRGCRWPLLSALQLLPFLGPWITGTIPQVRRASFLPRCPQTDSFIRCDDRLDDRCSFRILLIPAILPRSRQHTEPLSLLSQNPQNRSSAGRGHRTGQCRQFRQLWR
jgi:hypothetical protein